MPELPEVEVVCRSLREVLVGRVIVAFETTLEKLLKEPCGDGAYFAAHLAGSRVQAVDRRGKYILIHLADEQTLVVHLRMTGQLLYVERSAELTKHTHIVMPLDNGWELRYHDVRQFGAFYLVETCRLDSLKGLAALGVEPLSEEFTCAYLSELVRDRPQRAKAFLLDQRFIAGIGNIYADEILFQARIHPNDRIGDITDEEDIERLWQAVRERLSLGIAAGGSSIKDYVDARGQAGSFQEQHRVYGRAGERCVDCGGLIERIKVAGRSSCFCPNCQVRHLR